MAQQYALHQYGTTSIAGRATVQQGDRHITNHIFIETAHFSLSEKLNISGPDVSCSVARYGDNHLLSLETIIANSLHASPLATEMRSVLALALQVSRKVSSVSRSSKQLKTRLSRTRVRIWTLRMLLEKVIGTVTPHVSTKQGLSFHMLLEHIIGDGVQLLMEMDQTLDKVIASMSTWPKLLASMFGRSRSLTAHRELERYDHELEKRCSILLMCMEDQNKNFATPIARNVVRIQRARPIIEDAILNIDVGVSLNNTISDYLDFFISRMGFFRAGATNISFFHSAIGLVKRYQPPLRFKLLLSDFGVYDNEFYISKACLEPLWPKRLKNPPAPQRLRLSAQHTTQAAGKPLGRVGYPTYNILIDAREETDPFSRLLDALIFRLMPQSPGFWSAVRRYVTNGEATLILEQKIQLAVYVLRNQDIFGTPYVVRAGFLHEGPCFAARWKANLEAFSLLLRTIPFHFLHFTYECMRVDLTTSASFVNVLDKQQCTFAFNAGCGFSRWELYEYECQMVGNDGKMQGTRACAKPGDLSAAFDCRLIDSPKVQWDDVRHSNGAGFQPSTRCVVECTVRASRSKGYARPMKVPLNSKFLGGCPIPMYYRRLRDK